MIKSLFLVYTFRADYPARRSLIQRPGKLKKLTRRREAREEMISFAHFAPSRETKGIFSGYPCNRGSKNAPQLRVQCEA
jgi:hypothetical protein